MRRASTALCLLLFCNLAQAQTEFPPDLDPQSWVLPEWMTWDDYRPIPGVDWNDPARQPAKKLRAALILGDFSDRDFVVTQPEGSDVIGINGLHNPIGVGDIPRDEVARFYSEFLITTPSELNNFHTVNEYWLEDSYGLIGVDAAPFGPYRMTGKEHEYGLGGGDAGGGNAGCPSGDSCGQNFDNELITASLADVTAGIALNGGEDYDFRFLLHAAYDESGVWQELGEMIFPHQDDVTDALGNPDPDKPNWVGTRYVPWTSFAAGEGIWSHALPGVTSTQGESDGQATFAHELSHIFGVLDNYNNPFSEPAIRSYTGLWAMLSRGTFNGPGGTHQRWRIPGALAGSMGSHHMLRNKIRLGFMKPNEVLFLTRDLLAAGPQVATIYPRAYPLAPVTEDVGLHGIHIVMDEDRSPDCNVAMQFDCDGGGYTSYTVEVVDRIGYDSFTPDHGVLIAKNKDFVDLAPFMWAIDAHPEDINTQIPPPPNEHRMIYDFIRPVQVPETLSWPAEGEGKAVPITVGDARQLADALFHAGTGPGVVSEYLDEPNGLHFYVLDMQLDERGVRTYEVGVRAADLQFGPQSTALNLYADQAAEGAPGTVTELTFSLENAGERLEFFRLNATHGLGWETRLLRNVLALAPGEKRSFSAWVRIPEEALPQHSSVLTLEVSVDSTPGLSRLQLAPVTVVAASETSARMQALSRGGATGWGLLLLLMTTVWRRRLAQGFSGPG